jgi:hypothetical protein
MNDPKKDFFDCTLRELQAFAEEGKVVILVTPGATLITRHSFLLSVGQTVCKVEIGPPQGRHGQGEVGRERRVEARRGIVRGRAGSSAPPLCIW